MTREASTVPPGGDPAALARDASRRVRATHRWPDAGTLVALGIATWVTSAAWGPGPPSGGDVMAHLVRADFGIGELVAEGRLEGWFPRFYVGYEEFLVFGPGLTWLLAAVRGVTFGALTNTGALTVVVVCSFVGLPLAVAFAARSFGLDRRAAGIAAVLSLLVSSRYGVGIEGLFGVGLVAHQVGALLFFVVLGAVVRIAVDGRERWVALAAVALAGLVITHPVSVPLVAVFSLVSILSLLAIRRPSPIVVGRLALVCAAAAGLAAFWAIPFVAHRDLAGAVSTWATPSLSRRVDAVFDGDVLFQPYVAWVVVAAWAYAAVLFRRRSPYALALVAVPCAHLLVGAAAAWLFRGGVLEQVGNRGLAYAGIVAAFPLAALLAAASRRTGRVGGPLAVSLAGALALASVVPERGLVGQYPEPIPQMRVAATELAERVPAWARFATQAHPREVEDRLGVPEPERWLARASGRNSLNGFNTESTNASVWKTVPNIGRMPVPQLAQALTRLGVTHLVALSNEFADDLARSSRFTLEWQQAPVSIFSVITAPGRAPPSSLVSGAAVRAAAVRSAEPERVRLEIDTVGPTRVTVAIAWSPKWHARVDGEPVEAGRTPDGMLTIPVPEGTSTVLLDFRPDGWDGLGLVVSLLTVGSGIWWWSRRRRRPGEGTGRATSSPDRGAAIATGLVLAVAALGLSFAAVRVDGDAGACEEPPASVSANASDAAASEAASPEPGSVRLVAVSGLEHAIALAASGDGRLYLARQDGYVCVLGNAEPVLDISGEVSTGHAEQGLLGLAVSPGGRHLYVDFTDRDGNTRVSEFRLDADRAVPESRRDVLAVDQPYPNHNGGHLAFAPDGRLFIALGDGGDAGDPGGVSQSRRSLLGKLLRIEPRATAGRPYGIPDDNPFVGVDGGRPEIWASGLRNPWRFSFDEATGDLWIGDVGQFEYEEIDWLPAGSAPGANFGWDRLEGNHRHEGATPAGAVAPVFEYAHDDGNCAVIGGYVYRGRRVPELRGAYIFGDACSGRVMALRRRGGETAAGSVDVREVIVVGGGISSFGVDAAGELYVLTLQRGVHRLEPA